MKSKDTLIADAITLLSSKPMASMDEIAKATSVGRATLFRHFKTRQALIDEIDLVCNQRLKQAITPFLTLDLPADKILFLIIQALIAEGESFHFLTLEAFNLHNPQILVAHQEDMAVLTQLIEQLAKQGDVNDLLSSEWISGVIDQLIIHAWQMISQGKLTPEEATRLVWNTLTHSTLTHSDRKSGAKTKKAP